MNIVIRKAWDLQHYIEKKLRRIKPIRFIEFCLLIGIMFLITGFMLFFYFYLLDGHNYQIWQIVNFHETWNPIFYFVIGCIFSMGFLCLCMNQIIIKTNIRVWFEHNC